MHYLGIGIEFLVGAVFLISFCSKIKRAAFAEFADSLRDMGLVPARVARPVAASVVAAEGAIVLLVSVPLTLGAGFAAAAVLLVVFTGGIARTLRRGAAASCRCFGSSKAPLGVRHVVRNVALTACAALGALTTLMPPERIHLGGAVVAAAAGLVSGGLITVLDNLHELFFSTTHSVSPVNAGTGRRERRPDSREESRSWPI